MIAVAQIIELIQQHPDGMLIAEICAHFDQAPTSLSSRVSKLAAYGQITVRMTGKSVDGRGKTGGAMTRRYFPKVGALKPYTPPGAT